MSVIKKFVVGFTALVIFGLVFVHGAGLPKRLIAQRDARAIADDPGNSVQENAVYFDVAESAQADGSTTDKEVEKPLSEAPPLALRETEIISQAGSVWPASPIAADAQTGQSEIKEDQSDPPMPEMTAEARASAEAVATAREAARRCQQRIDRAMTGYQITFENNSVEISRGVARLLTELSFEFEECGSVKVEILGHTDARGDPGRNLALSQRRAAAVMAFLSRIGVGDIEMSANGMGETLPVASNNTDVGRARNRRIEFAVSPIATVPSQSHFESDTLAESE